MTTETIKFKTIQIINGVKYISEKQVEDLGHIVCQNLGIEASEKNFAIVRDACKIYFEHK